MSRPTATPRLRGAGPGSGRSHGLCETKSHLEAKLELLVLAAVAFGQARDEESRRALEEAALELYRRGARVPPGAAFSPVLHVRVSTWGDGPGLSKGQGGDR